MDVAFSHIGFEITVLDYGLFSVCEEVQGETGGRAFVHRDELHPGEQGSSEGRPSRGRAAER